MVLFYKPQTLGNMFGYQYLHQLSFQLKQQQMNTMSAVTARSLAI